MLDSIYGSFLPWVNDYCFKLRLNDLRDENFWPWMVNFFHHCSFNFRHLSFIKHHSKYPISYTHSFGTCYLACHHSKFSTFCGPHKCNLVRAKLLAYISSPIFPLFSFPLPPSAYIISPHYYSVLTKKKKKKSHKIHQNNFFLFFETKTDNFVDDRFQRLQTQNSRKIFFAKSKF